MGECDAKRKASKAVTKTPFKPGLLVRPTSVKIETCNRCVRCGHTWRKRAARTAKCKKCQSKYWDYTSNSASNSRGRPLELMIAGPETSVEVEIWTCQCSWCGYKWAQVGKPERCPNPKDDAGHDPRMADHGLQWGVREDWEASRQEYYESNWRKHHYVRANHAHNVIMGYVAKGWEYDEEAFKMGAEGFGMVKKEGAR